jgi:hypothetical protein
MYNNHCDQIGGGGIIANFFVALVVDELLFVCLSDFADSKKGLKISSKVHTLIYRNNTEAMYQAPPPPPTKKTKQKPN